MNVQINEHHPSASNTSLLYTIKYPLKPEPCTKIATRHESDDSVVQYLRGQFVSLSAATNFILQEPITQSSRGACPRLYPSWTFEKVQGQGLWTRYLRRWPYVSLLDARPGTFVPTVSSQALQLSVLFAPCFRFLRYFVDDARLPLPPPPKTISKKLLHGQLYDNPEHPHFDPVFTELLPVEHLVIAGKKDSRDVWKRVANSKLHFPRFTREFDLSLDAGDRGRSQRSCHFERRLLARLPWMWWKDAGSMTVENAVVLRTQDASTPFSGENFAMENTYMLSPLPLDTFSVPPPARLQELVEFHSLAVWTQVEGAPNLQAFRLRVTEFENLGKAPWEELCILLEQFLAAQDLTCACCESVRGDRCKWCLQACGWHRCQHRCRTGGFSLSCTAAWRWKRNSLYHIGGHDVDACVFDMLKRAAPKDRILRVLASLLDNQLLAQERCNELVRLITVNMKGAWDPDPLLTPSVHKLVLSHSEFSSLCASTDTMKQRLHSLEARMQNYWDADSAAYMPWHAFDPPRRVPSQYLAYLALLKRLDDPASFFVALVAPAGFGKTELLASLRLHCCLRNKPIAMTSLAVTGVAASQNAGSTVHNYFWLNVDGESNILNSESGRRRLAGLQLLVVDEAMMAESALMLFIQNILREVPLTECLRRAGALPDWGYRDIIVCGDIRQLPPASGKQPFWACNTFQQGFEIFCLTEDRRHEKDLNMQRLKELFAWGGCVPPVSLDDDADLQRAWQVDDRVFSFIVDGYLRGWGRTGRNVDLDLGTALFPKRVDARNWNDACINQIEDAFGEQGCEAVDIVGFDPFGDKTGKEPDKRLTHGIQTLPKLRLRTHPAHRMRFMLLHNINTSKGWVNGTRVRLLARSSWTGEGRHLQRSCGPPDSGCKQQPWTVASDAYVNLADEAKHPEFNVKVVKDEDFVLKRSVRFDDTDVHFIPVRTDESVVNGVTHAWKQVQGVPAYALTVHKSQGLTMLMVYLAFTKVFGFGQLYTALTRCPHVWATFLVGVPPKDVLDALLTKNKKGHTLIEAKRLEVMELLQDEQQFAEHVQSRIASGEFDLDKIAADCARSPGNSRSFLHASLDTYKQEAKDFVIDHIRSQLTDWVERLDVEKGLQAMLSVSWGFKRLPTPEPGVIPYENQGTNWQSLAEAFQIDATTRLRILFYKAVAVDWMCRPDVNVLATATLDNPCLPTREYPSREFSKVSSYGEVARPPCPEAPNGFQWESGIDERQAQKRAGRRERLPETVDPVDDPPVGELGLDNDAEDDEPPPSKFALPSTVNRARAAATENVAVPKDANTILIQRAPKKPLSAKASASASTSSRTAPIPALTTPCSEAGASKNTRKLSQDIVLQSEAHNDKASRNSDTAIDRIEEGADEEVAQTTSSDNAASSGHRNMPNSTACVQLQPRTSSDACGDGPALGDSSLSAKASASASSSSRTSTTPALKTPASHAPASGAIHRSSSNAGSTSVTTATESGVQDASVSITHGRGTKNTRKLSEDIVHQSEAHTAKASRNTGTAIDGIEESADEEVANATYCNICARGGVKNIFNSSECVRFQTQTSCHACGRGPSVGDSYSCWTCNPGCQYYRHGAGQRLDSVDAEATGRAAPNMSQVRPVELKMTDCRESWTAVVDGRDFMVGTASGAANNCLIHSLWQAVSDHCPLPPCVTRIRQELMREFNTPGDSQVTEFNFLTFEFHALPILRGFGALPPIDKEHAMRSEMFTVRLVHQESAHVADEIGTGPVILYIMNEGNRHFVPFLQKRDS